MCAQVCSSNLSILFISAVKALEETNHDQTDEVVETASVATLEFSDPEEIQILVQDAAANPASFLCLQ